MPADRRFYPFACGPFTPLGRLHCRLWPGGKTAQSGRKPFRPRREPTPFAGLAREPACEACERQIRSPPPAPSAPPPHLIVPRGRRRQVATTGHFCPHAACAHHGRVGFGNIRASGHPTGRRWRQLVRLGCRS
jgi:hypothetical protein